MAALSPGAGWRYNWASTLNAGVPSNYRTRHQMDYHPVLWNGSFNASAVVSFLLANPTSHYLLVPNEPNVGGQSCLTPHQAAQLWPQHEKIASAAGVKIVEPWITWGTMPNSSDPVAWLDGFHAAYEAANGGRQPSIDCLGFHWYDYPLGAPGS